VGPFREFGGFTDNVVIPLFYRMYNACSILFLGKSNPISDGHRVGGIYPLDAKVAFEVALNDIAVMFPNSVPAAGGFGHYASTAIVFFGGCH
jgi:hypothetical protein